MKNAFVLILCLFFLVMCNDRPKDLSPELSCAESLMQCHPDSALMILDSMKVPSPSDKLQYATWCLLITQARDKNFIKHTSDSLINIALDYFEEQDGPVRKATALYYEGRVNHDMDNPDEATEYYLRARDVAKGTTDYNLLHLINTHLGTLYLYRDLCSQTSEAYKAAYDYSLLMGDSSLISYSLSYLGRASVICGNMEKAVDYYKKAIAVANQSKNEKALSNAYDEIAAVYTGMTKLDSSLYYLKKVIDLDEKNGSFTLAQTYLGMGDTYRLMAQFDSSYYYLEKALNTTNIYTKQDASKSLYYLCRDFGKYKEAIEYNDQYWLYTDSVENIDRCTKIVEIQSKYDQEKLLNINNRLTIEKGKIEKIALWGLVIFLFVIGVLIFLYQRKLLNKERAIKNVKDQLQSHLIQLHENEDVIRQNENLIESLSLQMEETFGQLQLHSIQLHENEDVIRRKENLIESLSSQVETTSNLQKHIDGLTMEIEKIRNRNVLLQTQNKSLHEDIEKSVSNLQERGEELKAYKQLATKNTTLYDREKYLCNQLVKHIELLNRLKVTPKCIQESQWQGIFESIEIVYPNLINRLQKDFSSLTNSDLQVCCLIKLHLSNSQLSTLMGISPSSVTKRKQRLKERINQHLEIPLEKEVARL